MTSRLRASRGGARVGIVILLVLAVLVLGFAAFGLVLLRSVPDVAVVLVVTLFTLQLVGWVLTPLIAFGVDETVDPARFALLPIRMRDLQRGLLTSSLIGYLPAANVIVLLGAVVALSAPWSVLPVALVCAVLQLLTCVVLSRAASTAMSTLMESRRGRDLGMAVGFGIFVLYLALSWLLNSGGGSGVQSGVEKAAGIFGWLPSGSLALLPQLVATGQWGRVALAAVIGVAPLVLGWIWWRRALVTTLTTVSSSTESSAPSGASHDTSVGGGVAGTARVVAGRDRLLMWRDPMRRMPWLMIGVLIIAWPFFVARGPGGVYAVAFGALLIGTQSANQYGVDGSGLWLHLQTIADRARARGESVGHVVAAFLPGTVLVLVALALQATVYDAWDKVPGALGLALGVMLGGAAASTYIAAVIPYAMPQSRKSMFASSVPGQKGRTTRATLAILGIGLLVGVPAGIAVVLSLVVAPWWGWVALVLGPVCGFLALDRLVKVSADRYLQNGPEILATVAAGDRS
ncbi:hypothetical protein JL107_06900 [Nakamurella flavida]|uniref:Transporter n=1 Tax=Nakamurella flavida TaxID=363630 RepID=A0A938YN82_9ACTN|nr:hypothetical protein [Nakamurella flavida]MBM9476168.1 hypothetical protein [Nakamurella flavida]MDP9777087.1 ABC-2 type transport system permease protein [Nakamurella flavida]